jgi:hypothetical protein
VLARLEAAARAGKRVVVLRSRAEVDAFVRGEGGAESAGRPGA